MKEEGRIVDHEGDGRITTSNPEIGTGQKSPHLTADDYDGNEGNIEYTLQSSEHLDLYTLKESKNPSERLHYSDCTFHLLFQSL
jgi:hypothetical protein